MFSPPPALVAMTAVAVAADQKLAQSIAPGGVRSGPLAVSIGHNLELHVSRLREGLIL